MSHNQTIAGEMLQGEEHDWGPLEALIGYELSDCFMWMYEIELADGGRVHAYKHVDTRRYFHLGTDGRVFAYAGDAGYRPIERGEAIDEAFRGFVRRHWDLVDEERRRRYGPELDRWPALHAEAESEDR